MKLVDAKNDALVNELAVRLLAVQVKTLSQKQAKEQAEDTWLPLRINDDKALVNTLGNSLKKVSVETVKALTSSRK